MGEMRNDGVIYGTYDVEGCNCFGYKQMVDFEEIVKRKISS